MKNPIVEKEPGEESVQEQLNPLVEQAILNIVRQVPLLDFSADCIESSFGEYALQRWLSLPKNHPYQNRSLVAAVKRAGKAYRTFITEVKQEEPSGTPTLVVSIHINDGFDWPEMLAEAWNLAPEPNPYQLTDNGVKIFNWLKSGKFDGKPLDSNSLGRRCNLRGSYIHIDEHLKEIQLKTNLNLRFEGGRWRAPVKIWFEAANEAPQSPSPLNPPLRLFTKQIVHAELERFRVWLYKTIRQTSFAPNGKVIRIFEIRDRKTLNQCFQNWSISYQEAEVGRFFDAVRLIDGIELTHDFELGAGPWLVNCQLQDGWAWAQIQKSLQYMASEIPLEKKYGLSPDSTALLKWIRQLRSSEFLSGLTPPVENNLALNIGIAPDWGQENVPAYIELLVEEINEKTDYDLRTQKWHHYSHVETRIRVKKKCLELDTLVRSVQLFGLARNCVLESQSVRNHIEALVNPRSAQRSCQKK